MDIASFAKRMKQLASNVVTNQNTRVRDSALAVHKELVNETPVDTGRAKSNWFVSINSGFAGQIDAYVPGKNGSTSGSNSAITIAKAQGTLQFYKVPDSIYITNNLPYIWKLNHGSSNQSPGGFIEAAMEKAKGPIAIISARGLLGDTHDN